MMLHWDGSALEALSKRAEDAAFKVADRIMQQFQPIVHQVVITHDDEIDDAGQFWFTGGNDTTDPEPTSIIVNTRRCRTTLDLAYVLLHEVRHAQQFQVLGAGTLAQACVHNRFWTDMGHKLEEDASAWAIDRVRAIKPGRKLLLNAAGLHHNSIYDCHRSERSRLRLGWPW